MVDGMGWDRMGWGSSKGGDVGLREVCGEGEGYHIGEGI